MRIGIIIGISEYDNPDNLPGCINDVNAINDLLHSSKEFDEIKLFKGSVKSDSIKSELPKLFKDLKGKSIDELFFYFSGHGSFINNEFYYILTDFDETVKRQTSLQNSEIDNMIKSIKPKMVTKVIDACQSGVSYIKGNTNVVEKYYAKTTDNFEKCYFLHSSMTSQYSYQTDELSDFTKSFLESIKSNSKSDIRYKDIIDYISDEFEKSTEQTPFFITQADHTEKFLSSSSEISIALDKYIKKSEKSDPKPTTVEATSYDSYIEKIKKDAEIYCTQEEVIELLNQLKELIEGKKLQTEIAELYSFSTSFEYYLRDLPKGVLIARWLESNPNDFFASPDYERESYQEEESTVNPFGGISNLFKQNKIVTKYRNVLKGFEQPLEIPFKYVIVDFKPKYPNLTQYALLITFLISRKEIKFFTAFTNYQETDWTRKVINENFKWSSDDFLIKNQSEIKQYIERTISNTEREVMNIILNKFNTERK
jgi:hypothetical protein